MATDVLLAPTPALQPEHFPAGRRGRLSDVAVLALLGWWGTLLTWGTGGREPHLLSVGLVLLAGALVTLRPWTLLPLTAVVLALGLSTAAMLVPVVAPTGGAGASEAASWVFGALTCLVACAWARHAARSQALLVLLAAAPLFSFAKGFVAWWGSGDPSKPFVGTFYWHNQAAAFLLVGVAAGLALVTARSSAYRLVGWLAVPLCGAGVVVSTSRASMALLALTLVIMLLAALFTRAWSVALKTAVLSVLVALTSSVITGPPIFSSRAAVLAGTAERAGTGQSLGTNGGHRLDDWSWAIAVFRHWPLAGTGFRGFGDGSRQIDPSGHGSLTPFAHNGFLQLLVDGGLLLALPALAALAVVGVTAIRRGTAAFVARDWPTVAMVIALAALALHSAVDFDWSYPALVAAFGLVAGYLCAGPRVVVRTCPAWLGWAAVALVLVAAVSAWPGGLDLSAPVGSHA